MFAPTFEIGDLVKLKSGGPTLTVVAISEETQEVTCRWFSPTEGLLFSGFPPQALVKVAE